MQTLLQLNGVVAGYENQPILKGVNLSVNPLDFVGIIGPNGGGKTTLLKVILGLIQPMEGVVTRDQSLRIGYLPQINTIDKRFPITVEEVVLSGRYASSSWWKKPVSKDYHRVAELLEFVGLTTKRKDPIGELSGGQMQRVFLSRALISQPNLLILDEPNTYVDKSFEQDLYNLLFELNKEMGVLLVSHDVGTISAMVKTIACVNGGLHYHPTNKISNEILQSYNCPVEILTHGTVPHRVVKNH